MKRLCCLLLALALLLPAAALAAENPDYYAGELRDASGNVTVYIVESLKDQAPDYAAIPGYTVEYVDYSLNELEAEYARLRELTYPAGLINGMDLSVADNRITVYMTMPSENNIALFRQTAGDSPMVRFEMGFADVESALYDPDFGGSYEENGVTVTCVVESLAGGRVESDTLRFVDYSLNDLNDLMVNQLYPALEEHQDELTRCTFNNLWVDQRENRVMIDLDELTAENEALFREEVLDSPMLAFTSTRNTVQDAEGGGVTQDPDSDDVAEGTLEADL